MIGIGLTFQRQLQPEKKPIFRSEFERKGTVPLSYTMALKYDKFKFVWAVVAEKRF